MAQRDVHGRVTLSVAALICGAGLASLALPLAGPPPQGMAMPGAAPVSAPALPLATPAIPRADARRINAAIPYEAAALPAARPFPLAGDAESRERAVDCLAAAMWYEAGGDDAGQRAVGQVVLNRVRHPAFPASVCAVVFEGSERVTGCQFTFTCDGALRRRPPSGQWAEARARARAALHGRVEGAVGLATHYHTDWVHPAWSAQLAKIARVETHLFFRWHGAWGQPEVMTAAYSAAEPFEPLLRQLSLAHAGAPEPAPFDGEDRAILLAENADLQATRIALAANVHEAATPVLPEGVHFLDTTGAGEGAGLAMQAMGACGDAAFCKVVGWAPGLARRTQMPASEAERAAVAFLYVRDRRTGVDRALWDCARFARSNSAQCLGADRAGWIAFDGNFHAPRQVARIG